MKKLQIVAVVFLLGTAAFSQGHEATDYVKTFPNKWQLSIISSFRDFNQLIGYQGSSAISYRNTTFNMGARIRFKRFGLAAHWPVKYIHPGTGNRSDNYSLGFSVHPGNFNLSGKAGYVRGFERLSGNGSAHRPDVQMTYLNGSVGYLFNSEKFSMRAPFKFFEVQKESAGSPMAMMTASFIDVNDTDGGQLFEEEVSSNVNRMRVMSFGVGAGYGFTFTKGGWFVTPVLSAVGEVNERRYYDVEKNKLLGETRLKPVLIGQLSLGYNCEKYFLGLVSYYRPGFGPQVNFDSDFYRLRVSLMVGFRFDRLMHKKQLRGWASDK